MGIGTECDRDITRVGHANQGGCGIDFAAGLAETGGVQFDGATGGQGGVEETLE
jgi:hypothetical protein